MKKTACQVISSNDIESGNLLNEYLIQRQRVQGDLESETSIEKIDAQNDGVSEETIP